MDSLPNYCRIGAWHEDSPRKFVAATPVAVDFGAALVDEQGAQVGRVVKVWPWQAPRASIRIELAPHAAHDYLRDDLLCYERTLIVEAPDRLRIGPRIDTKSLPAAPQSAPPDTWTPTGRVVAPHG